MDTAKMYEEVIVFGIQREGFNHDVLGLISRNFNEHALEDKLGYSKEVWKTWMEHFQKAPPKNRCNFINKVIYLSLIHWGARCLNDDRICRIEKRIQERPEEEILTEGEVGRRWVEEEKAFVAEEAEWVAELQAHVDACKEVFGKSAETDVFLRKKFERLHKMIHERYSA